MMCSSLKIFLFGKVVAKYKIFSISIEIFVIIKIEKRNDLFTLGDY